MVTTVREIVVVVASPGDCAAERRRVLDVANDVNDALGTQMGLRLRVTGWENVPPDLGRPQGQINPLIDECDVFIGLLALSWGSPTGEYDSGFHEEFERVRQRRGQGSRPQVALFFADIDADRLHDPGVQLQAVLDFQTRVRDERLALYKSFSGPDDLAYKLMTLFTHILTEATAEYATSADDGSSANAAAPADSSDDLGAASVDDARRQIAETTDTVTRLARHGTAANADADRLLLIALALNGDGGYLPTHVGNRLYVRRAALTLSVMEESLWRDSLLADVGSTAPRESRVMPGFALCDVQAALADATTSDDDNVARGAFRVLEESRHRTPELWDVAQVSADDLARRWVEALDRGPITEAALTYLASVADGSDVALLDAILPQRDDPIVAAIRGLVAGDAALAAQVLVSDSRQRDWMVSAVSAQLSDLAGATVKALATSRKTDDDLARAAFDELAARGDVDDETLTGLLQRGTGVDAIIEASDRTALPTAEQIGRVIDSLGDKQGALVADLRTLLAAMTSDVDQLLERADLGAYKAWEALAHKKDPRLADRARTVFDTDAAEFIRPMEENEAWRDESELIAFIRWKLRMASLRMIVASGAPTDADRQRIKTEIAAKTRWGFDDAERLYLQVATSMDIDFLVAHLDDAHGQFREELVETILRLAGAEGARAILRVSPDKDGAVRAVQALGAGEEVADELRELLFSPHKDLRIAAVAELAKRWSRAELEALLDDYPKERDTYYYNVVVELDRLLFGVGVVTILRAS